VPGHKVRIWFPKFTDHTTPTHQDFVHYQGSLDTLTCWAPVGDGPIELGPLAVLERSHKVRLRRRGRNGVTAVAV
jgi:ectoine hydroxylase-related dioxygenase (phytanoyl-CoA dioxygenase family)